GDSWRIAETIILTRKSVGLPHDLAAAPSARRRVRSGSFIAGPLASVLANCDGQQNLADLLRLAQWEMGISVSDQAVHSAIDEVALLADHGYLGLDCSAAQPELPL